MLDTDQLMERKLKDKERKLFRYLMNGFFPENRFSVSFVIYDSKWISEDLDWWLDKMNNSGHYFELLEFVIFSFSKVIFDQLLKSSSEWKSLFDILQSWNRLNQILVTQFRVNFLQTDGLIGWLIDWWTSRFAVNRKRPDARRRRSMSGPSVRICCLSFRSVFTPLARYNHNIVRPKYQHSQYYPCFNCAGWWTACSLI